MPSTHLPQPQALSPSPGCPRATPRTAPGRGHLRGQALPRPLPPCQRNHHGGWGGGNVGEGDYMTDGGAGKGVFPDSS